MNDGQVAIGAEGRSAGEHLVEHHAEGPEVGAPIRATAANLFGCHVRHCAERDAGARQARAIAQLGDAKVENLHEAVAGDHQVRRLDIAVHNPRLMCFLEAPRDLHRDLERVRDWQAARAPAAPSAFHRRSTPSR